MTRPRIVALLAARNEGARIGDTVRSLRCFPELTEIVVVDDGSSDRTASAALAAGATVLSIPRRAGKGRALEGALRRLPPADAWLMADGDIGASAVGLQPVLAEVLEGRAELAIAVLPAAVGGGFGIVKRMAGRAIRAACGFDPSEPLSGQRAVTDGCLQACRPLARGFGVESAMTVDAVRAGLRVVEIRADLSHRPTGRSLRGFAHRGKQGLDIVRALGPRLLRLR
ncbi:MAG: glycosyltransferase [Actinomycetota bacterium]